MDNISSSLLLNGNDFSVFRADRHEREGGGVCIITNNIINATMTSIPDQYSDVEIVAVDIQYVLLQIINTVLFAHIIHLTPILIVNSMCACLESITNVAYPVFILCDFNFPEIDWINKEMRTSNC